MSVLFYLSFRVCYTKTTRLPYNLAAMNSVKMANRYNTSKCKMKQLREHTNLWRCESIQIMDTKITRAFIASECMGYRWIKGFEVEALN